MNTEITTTNFTISSRNVDKIFKNYDPRVIAYIKAIVTDLDVAYYNNIPVSFKPTLELLANLLKTYYMFVDELDNCKGNIKEIKWAQNGLIAITRQITNLTSTFGADALSQAKLARLQAVSTNDQSQDAIADLIS